MGYSLQLGADLCRKDDDATASVQEMIRIKSHRQQKGSQECIWVYLILWLEDTLTWEPINNIPRQKIVNYCRWNKLPLPRGLDVAEVGLFNGLLV